VRLSSEAAAGAVCFLTGFISFGIALWSSCGGALFAETQVS